jgi:KTSC domain
MLTRWNNVESSNVSAIAYDSDSKEIIVLFHNNSVYAYKAENGLFQEFLDAESAGKFVHGVLKARQIPFRRVDIA